MAARNAFAIGLALVLGLPECGAQSVTRWLSGSSLERQLAETVGVDWSGEAFRTAIEGLTRSRQVAVLVDRRVDPDRPLTMRFSNEPLSVVLEQVAGRCGLGISRLGPVIYVGPVASAAGLRTLAELRRDEAKGRDGAADRFLASRALRWPELAEPRQIIAQVANEADIAATQLDQIPHDVWAAGELPPIPLVDRLTLLLIQFDRTFAIGDDGASFRIVPIGPSPSLVRSYAMGSAAARRAVEAASGSDQIQLKTVGEKVYVKARLEDHERIAGTPRPTVSPPKAAGASAKRSTSAKAEQRFTVKQAKGQLDRLLDDFSVRLGLELKIDHAALEQAGVTLRQPVEFSVNDASLDQLLKALLQSTGCTFRREGRTVVILPAK